MLFSFFQPRFPFQPIKHRQGKITSARIFANRLPVGYLFPRLKNDGNRFPRSHILKNGRKEFQGILGHQDKLAGLPHLDFDAQRQGFFTYENAFNAC